MDNDMNQSGNKICWSVGHSILESSYEVEYGTTLNVPRLHLAFFPDL